MMLKALPEPLKRLVLYAVCGGCGVALDFAVYTALLSFGLWYQGANLIGYAAGTVLSFLLNRVITFRVLDAPVRRFATFALVAAIGYLLSAAALWVLVSQLHIDPLLAKLCTLALVLAAQFSLNSLITFRTRRAP